MKKEINIFESTSHLSAERMLHFLRHKVSREEAHEIERHLTDCELCSDALEGLKKLDKESSMLRISHELHKLARKRKVVSGKIFTRPDFITLFAVVFILLFLIAIALLMFR